MVVIGVARHDALKQPTIQMGQISSWIQAIKPIEIVLVDEFGVTRDGMSPANDGEERIIVPG